MPFDDNDMKHARVSLCDSCKHYNKNYPPTCKAFPRGIPLSILNGTTDHREPVRGDKGVQYESA